MFSWLIRQLILICKLKKCFYCSLYTSPYACVKIILYIYKKLWNIPGVVMTRKMRRQLLLIFFLCPSLFSLFSSLFSPLSPRSLSPSPPPRDPLYFHLKLRIIEKIENPARVDNSTILKLRKYIPSIHCLAFSQFLFVPNSQNFQ